MAHTQGIQPLSSFTGDRFYDHEKNYIFHPIAFPIKTLFKFNNYK